MVAKLTIATLWLCFFTFQIQCDLEKGWKGIRVWESNRQDVERAFGKPTEGDEVEAKYETADSLIRVLFSQGPCVATDTVTGSFNVKAGVVIQYDVAPKPDLQLKDLRWKPELYERHVDVHVGNMVNYYNQRHGIRFSTAKIFGPSKAEVVTHIHFGRTKEQTEKVTCKNIA